MDLFQWIGLEQSKIPRLKGIIASKKYPVVYIWSKNEQDISSVFRCDDTTTPLIHDQLLYYSKSEGGGYESLWKIKESFISEYQKYRPGIDPEDELIFEELYENLSDIFSQLPCYEK